MNAPIPPLAWALLAALGVLWGGSFLFTALALRELSPAELVWARCAIAAPALWAVVLTTRARIPRGRSALTTIAGMAFLNIAAPFTLIAYAQQSIPAGLAAILNATTPIWGALLALAFLREPAMPLRLAGMALGVAGIATLTGFPTPGEALPFAAMLAATLFYAVSGLWARRIARDGIPALTAAAGQVTAAALMLTPFVVAGGPPPIPSAPTLLVLLVVGLACTALAYAIFFRIIALAGGQNVMLVTFLIPPVAVALGILILEESLLARHLLGMAIILAGLALIDGRIAAAWARRGTS